MWLFVTPFLGLGLSGFANSIPLDLKGHCYNVILNIASEIMKTSSCEIMLFLYIISS